MSSRSILGHIKLRYPARNVSLSRDLTDSQSVLKPGPPVRIVRLLFLIALFTAIIICAGLGCESMVCFVQGTPHRPMKELNNDFKEWLKEN